MSRRVHPGGPGKHSGDKPRRSARKTDALPAYNSVPSPEENDA
jgi:hypothetical protein